MCPETIVRSWLPLMVSVLFFAAYDRPDETVLGWADVHREIERVPSLLDNRTPTKLSLWSTAGKMEDWKRIDTANLFPPPGRL